MVDVRIDACIVVCDCFCVSGLCSVRVCPVLSNVCRFGIQMFSIVVSKLLARSAVTVDIDLFNLSICLQF